MIDVFIINMLKDVQKKKEMNLQLENQENLNVTFIKAIEGKEMTDKELSDLTNLNKFKERYKTFATLPALGCSLSHLSVYKKIKDDVNLDVALILEDDAKLCPKLADKLIYWVNLLQNTDQPVVILLTPGFKYLKKDLVEVHQGSELYHLHSGVMTSGYLINKEACKLLYDKLTPASYLADAWGEFCKMGLVLYGIKPHLISFSGELGEIGKSQRLQQRTCFQLIRFRLASIKGFISRVVAYVKGYRKSTKNW